MRIYKMLATLLLLPALYSCQSELPQDNNSPETPQETGEPYKLTVKATVPGSNNTRAQITYGNTSINEETFIWDKEEEINLINITRINDCPFGVILYEVKLSEDKRTAEFGYVASEHPNFTVKQGDVILAVYGEINRDAYKDNAGNVIYDERNIIHLGVGTEGNKPQYIYNLNTSTPQDLTESLSYMKDNLKMYDIVTAVEDGKVPDLHFKHLSAIFRITLHNASGKDLYPTKLEFEYPPSNDSTTNPEDNNEDTRSGENNEKSDSNDIAGSLLSFFNTTLYFSVAGNEADGYYLKVYDTKEFFTSSSNAYTDHIGTT
ncbi:MAG: hypothetical protein K2H60_09170, partial [Muribaculaceae bacterium]|nr:hypothetical protein [Muribaculaceae bacterium]